jgi:hypothetical protein
MMKVNIEFNIEGEDGFYEQQKLNQMMAANDALSALYDIDKMLRNKYRYPENFKHEEDRVEAIRESFYEILKDNNIDLDRLFS